LAVGGTFTDDDTSPFEPDIEWMASSGVTLGCGPGVFCPDDFVTRGQMAAFMHRLAQFFGGEDGVVSQADQATIGLSPVAFAAVLSDGSVVPARSRGVTDANVTLEATSAFCFRDLPFDFVTAQASPIYEGGASQDVSIEIGLPGVGFGTGDCAGGALLEVATSEDSDYSPHGFYVWFYN